MLQRGPALPPDLAHGQGRLRHLLPAPAAARHQPLLATGWAPGEKYLHWNPKNICNTRTRYPSPTPTPSSWWRRRWTPTTRCSAPRGTSCPPTPARCGSLKSTRRTTTILCASSENNTHDIMIMTTMHDAYVVNYNDPPDPLFLEPDDFFFFLTAVPAISLLTMVSRLGSTSRHTLMGT